MRVTYAHQECQSKTMSNMIFNPTAPKKSANLSINADLLRQAKQLNINLSQTLEQHLAEIIRQAQRSQWLAGNQSALDEYNRRIEKHGTFSDGLRRF
jgi:antitoxin CcdA